jgi:hypothetical protein
MRIGEKCRMHVKELSEATLKMVETKPQLK